jgi:hypothetical protein
MQRLAELEADDARPEYRDAPRQRGPFEQRLVRDEARPERRPRGGKGGRRPRGDHGGGGLDRDVADGERRVVDEARVTDDLVGVGDRIDALRYEADETIALAPHACHHRGTVDAHVAVEAERTEALDCVRGLGRCDQQLARHAADARAGRAVDAAFDQQRRAARGLRGPVRREACGTGTDHRNVGLQGAHGGKLTRLCAGTLRAPPSRRSACR